jgi:murein DD-endopeptidase MepM/ murein hydrolase activator NlpD
MPIISVALARQYASQAGFVGSGIDTIVAIAQAESSLNTGAQHTNSDGSLDRGILQINNRYHSEVSDSCAYDAACSFGQGYRISNKGTNFTAWSTYTSGAYLRYMPTGSSTLTNGSKGVGTAWYLFQKTHGYITKFAGNGTDTPHYAIDFGAPMDTPFFFLESGTIDKESYQPWGGEVFEKPDAGGPEEYVFHLDQINVVPGQHVQAGEVVGLSGGQTSGGSHPTSSQYSTGPHIHFGRFTNYVSTPDPNNPTIPFGPDPSPLLAQAEQSGLVAIGSGGDSGSTSTSGGTEPQDIPLAEKVNAILSEFPGFAGICLTIDKAEQFPGIIQYQPGGTAASPPPAWTYFIPGAPGIYQGVEAVFQPQDYVGPAIRSVLDTIISNAIPLFLRSMIAGIGFLLVAGLVWKAADASGLVEAAGQIGAVAA